jgi:hypothetical protein
MHSEAANHANHIHWSRQQTADQLTSMRLRLKRHELELMALETRARNATQRVLEHERLLVLLSNHHFPRLPAIITQSRREGFSVKALTDRLEVALEGHYHSQSRYSQRELDFALLSYRFGGHRQAYALQQEYGLPALRTVMRKHVHTFLRVSVSLPNVTDTAENIRELVVEPRASQSRPRIICSIQMDETPIRPSVCYIPYLHSMGGICPCKGVLAGDLTSFDGQMVEKLAWQLSSDGEAPALAHLATQATVVALGFLGRYDYSSTPFIVSGCCGSKDASDFVDRLDMILTAYKNSGAVDKFGWPASVQTDGDSTRRKGGFTLLTSCELNRSSALGKLIYPLMGMNCMVGPHDITIGFDWKHNAKRERFYLCFLILSLTLISGMSSALRSSDGVCILGRAVTAPLLAQFFAQAGFREREIVAMLEPADAQNVPAAIALIQSLRVIGGIPDSQLPHLTQRKDRNAIRVLAEIFGAFINAFINSTSSLSQQMTSLAKYAFLAAYYFRQEKDRFLNNVLFTDSIACVKDAFFSLAKQQILDPEQDFFLFLLGTDGVEKLFAAARMTGGHSPNFGLYELTQRLSSALDINRILSQYPEWYTGHRRLSTARGTHADHLSPSAWKGNAKAGSVQLTQVWNVGAEEARRVIGWFTDLDHPVNWVEFFSAADCDIQRPCSGSGYPGVVCDARLPAKVEASINDADVAESDDEDDNDEAAATPDVAELESDGDIMLDDDTVAGSLDALAKKRAHSIYIHGKWIHMSTVVRLWFNSSLQPKQSKERLQRVRDYTPPSVAAHIKGLLGSSFMVGHCVATLLRCDNSAHLAIIQVTHLKRAGQPVYSVSMAEISCVEAQIELGGQVLLFKPQNARGQQQWSWKGGVVRLRQLNLKKTAKAKEIHVLPPFPGILAIPVTIPEVSSSEQVLNSWDILEEEMFSLSSRLWSQISCGHSSKLAACSVSNAFPYRTLKGNYLT